MAKAEREYFIVSSLTLGQHTESVSPITVCDSIGSVAEVIKLDDTKVIVEALAKAKESGRKHFDIYGERNYMVTRCKMNRAFRKA